MEEVICQACGYQGDIRTYTPAISAYNDIRCPKCGSTNNQHNSDYQRKLTNILGGNVEPVDEEVIDDDE